MFPLLLAAFEGVFCSGLEIMFLACAVLTHPPYSNPQSATAARLTGWEQLCKHATVIYEESLKILEESAKDDLADADEDGMADVEQISSNDLVRRKVKLVLTKMEPQQVRVACNK
jgi:hypothetical protein